MLKLAVAWDLAIPPRQLDFASNAYCKKSWLQADFDLDYQRPIVCHGLRVQTYKTWRLKHQQGISIHGDDEEQQ